MENKEVVTSKKITQQLIIGWFLWGIIFGLFYTIISPFIIHLVKSRILQIIITIILQGILVFLVWQSSTASTFKKRTMNHNDLPTVMRNLTIFTIIICIVNAIYNYSTIDNTIDKAINSDFTLQLTESRLSYLYDDDEMAEYQKEKEDMIQKAKKQIYVYWTFLEIGSIAVCLMVLPLEKKQILKYLN